MPPDAAVLTASYTINLLAPAAGERFTITGEVVRAGRTLVVCRGEAFERRPAAVRGHAGDHDRRVRPSRHNGLSFSG
jgi:acyl-coenzyme A thioesterase PaaI-like protein